jgi:hypothetical protein
MAMSPVKNTTITVLTVTAESSHNSLDAEEEPSSPSVPSELSELPEPSPPASRLSLRLSHREPESVCHGVLKKVKSAQRSPGEFAGELLIEQLRQKLELRKSNAISFINGMKLPGEILNDIRKKFKNASPREIPALLAKMDMEYDIYMHDHFHGSLWLPSLVDEKKFMDDGYGYKCFK